MSTPQGDGFRSIDSYFINFEFQESMEADEARVEVLLEDAVQALHVYSNGFTEYDEEPISMEARRHCWLTFCEEAFDRIASRRQAKAVPT